jgi:hypothetical protein
MRGPRLAIVLLAAGAAALLGACRERPETAASNTAVLGGYGPPRSTGPEAAGAIPPPRVPRNATPQIAMVGSDAAVAVWEQDGQVVASRFSRARGWEAAQPLERIAGQASNARIAGNGQGVAMALWQHTVGRIESLRYSRFEADKGWSPPDVMPGALPRPRQPGKTAGGTVAQAAPQIEVDAHGNARAEWRSGFDEDEVQASTFVAGEGWTRPVDLPLQASR